MDPEERAGRVTCSLPLADLSDDRISTRRELPVVENMQHVHRLNEQQREHERRQARRSSQASCVKWHQSWTGMVRIETFPLSSPIHREGVTNDVHNARAPPHHPSIAQVQLCRGKLIPPGSGSVQSVISYAHTSVFKRHLKKLQHARKHVPHQQHFSPIARKSQGKNFL